MEVDTDAFGEAAIIMFGTRFDKVIETEGKYVYKVRKMGHFGL